MSEREKETVESMDFVGALEIAKGVLEQYRKDQPKWWKRMDGTPILNDVAVRMAEAFVNHRRGCDGMTLAPGAAEAIGNHLDEVKSRKFIKWR